MDGILDAHIWTAVMSDDYRPGAEVLVTIRGTATHDGDFYLPGPCIKIASTAIEAVEPIPVSAPTLPGAVCIVREWDTGDMIAVRTADSGSPWRATDSDGIGRWVDEGTLSFVRVISHGVDVESETPEPAPVVETPGAVPCRAQRGLPAGIYAVVRATIPSYTDVPGFRGTFIRRAGGLMPWFGGNDDASVDDWSWWSSSDLTDVRVVSEGESR